MTPYDPHNWFWFVAGQDNRAWSVAAGGYVTQWDDARATYIESEETLTDVLRACGLPGPKPTEADYAAKVQAHVDAVAQSHGYLDGATCASYTASTVVAWKADAEAFLAWRDTIWLNVLAQLAAFQAGQISAPSVADVVASLPPMVWPS